MNRAIKDFIRISNALGADPGLVQGGGGNTSVKAGGKRMYVKASGVPLKEVSSDRGYRIIDLDACRRIMNDPAAGDTDSAESEADMAAMLEKCCCDDLHGRPSVETNLHALLGRCVAHTHPAPVNALLCSANPASLLSDLYGGISPPFLHLPYVDFGYPLAKTLMQAAEGYRKEFGAEPEVIFLENHGLIVSADTADEVLSTTKQIVRKAEALLRKSKKTLSKRTAPAPDADRADELLLAAAATLRKAFRGKLGKPVLATHDMCVRVREFMEAPDPQKLAGLPALVPDQQLYCNGAPLWIGFCNSPETLRKKINDAMESEFGNDRIPACIIVDGLGMFTAGISAKLLESARTTMLAALEIMTGASALGTPRPLPGQSLRYIAGSDWEAYRRSLLAGAHDGASDISGRVAVVSGAGSGLGRGISIGLVRKGMHVILADIDMGGMHETARRAAQIESPGAGSALPLRADVTDEAQVRTLFTNAVKQLGGVDLLVNCASIAPPLPLLEFTADAFRKTLDINLTGYMLMAREAARTMCRQDMGGGIINISSKSALEASKNHSAYNATKAGELHMARGWALELAPFGIRVNSICPGNVFRESKIWNEDYIKALAGKRGIRPEEVIPSYINMTALKKEISWDDIADAAAFLAGDGASGITGQTLVVDAGQVFVR